MNAHITKPIDPAVLYSTLAEYLEVQDTHQDIETGDPQQSQPPDEDALVMAQLAQIEKLDARQALIKMSGRSRLYLGLVADFYKEQQTLKQTILDLFAKADWATLYRTVHSLKSNAAYIGAYQLSTLSETVERALGKLQDKTVGENPKSQYQFDHTLINKLCDMLEAVLNDLNAVYAPSLACDAAGSANLSNKNVVFSNDLLQQQLNEIIPLLKSSSFAVEDKLPELSKLCEQTNYAAPVAQIAEYVEDIEYEKATVLAQSLLSELS